MDRRFRGEGRWAKTNARLDKRRSDFVDIALLYREWFGAKAAREYLLHLGFREPMIERLMAGRARRSKFR